MKKGEQRIVKTQEAFYRNVIRIALPVTLQSLLQASFGVVDQMMVGRLGSGSIAGVGLGGKFSSLYSVLLGAVAAAAGIMISQYMGQKQEKEVRRSFFSNLFLALVVSAVFFVLCVLVPEPIMGLYTKDEGTRAIAAGYLRILAFSYVPMAVSLLASTMLRCMEAAMLPLYASLLAAVLNTGLNYLLIFGKAGFPQLGADGAAAATVISQLASCVMVSAALYLRAGNRLCLRKPAADGRCDPYAGKEADTRVLPSDAPQSSANGEDHRCGNQEGSRLIGKKEGADQRKAEKGGILRRYDSGKRRQYLGILCPIIVCEFLWSLGENVYTAIYGNMGTAACAAMTLTIPVQTLLIGALSGLSQAAGILIGKSLGSREYEKAYRDAGKLMLYGLGGSVLLSVFLLGTGRFYVRIYQVEPEVQLLARQLLTAFAVIAPVKVQNMILGGGIIRSGGKTKYVMWTDIIGTWGFGVPLGFLAAFVWRLPLPYVYFILSLEECVRLVISFVIFRRRIWMRSLK